jgi:hypothetical protein
MYQRGEGGAAIPFGQEGEGTAFPGMSPMRRMGAGLIAGGGRIASQAVAAAPSAALAGVVGYGLYHYLDSYYTAKAEAGRAQDRFEKQLTGFFTQNRYTPGWGGQEQAEFMSRVRGEGARLEKQYVSASVEESLGVSASSVAKSPFTDMLVSATGLGALGIAARYGAWFMSGYEPQDAKRKAAEAMILEFQREDIFRHYEKKFESDLGYAGLEYEWWKRKTAPGNVGFGFMALTASEYLMPSYKRGFLEEEAVKRRNLEMQAFVTQLDKETQQITMDPAYQTSEYQFFQHDRMVEEDRVKRTMRYDQW